LFLGGEKVGKGELAKEGKSIQIDPPFLLNILYKKWHIGDGNGLGRAYYHPPTRKTIKGRNIHQWASNYLPRAFLEEPIRKAQEEVTTSRYQVTSPSIFP
jgi:hypothetical protein